MPIAFFFSKNTFQTAKHRSGRSKKKYVSVMGQGDSSLLESPPESPPDDKDGLVGAMSTIAAEEARHVPKFL